MGFFIINRTKMGGREGVRVEENVFPTRVHIKLKAANYIWLSYLSCPWHFASQLDILYGVSNSCIHLINVLFVHLKFYRIIFSTINPTCNT